MKTNRLIRTTLLGGMLLWPTTYLTSVGMSSGDLDLKTLAWPIGLVAAGSVLRGIGKSISSTRRVLRSDWTASHPSIAKASLSGPQDKRIAGVDPHHLAELQKKNHGVTLAQSWIAMARGGAMLLLLMLLTGASLMAQCRLAVRMTEDNDVYFGTDRYYSNGARVEVLFENRRSPLDALVLPLAHVDSRVAGFGVSQAIYTPSNTHNSGFAGGDRPYAGTLTIDHFVEKYNATRHIRVTSGISMGKLGPDSYAGDTQMWFHDLIHNERPAGWSHQVATGLILNYRMRVEKGLVALKHAEFHAYTGAELGTLVTGVAVGTTVRLGWLDSYFASPLHQRRALCAYIFFKPAATLLMGDKTLQGRPQTGEQAIDPNQVNHLGWQYELGATLRTGRLALSASEVANSEDRDGSGTHRFGRIALTVQIL